MLRLKEWMDILLFNNSRGESETSLSASFFTYIHLDHIRSHPSIYLFYSPLIVLYEKSYALSTLCNYKVLGLIVMYN